MSSESHGQPGLVRRVVGRWVRAAREFRSWPGYWLLVLGLLALFALAAFDTLGRWERASLRLYSGAGALFLFARATAILGGRIEVAEVRAPWANAGADRLAWYGFLVASVALVAVAVLR